MHLTVFKQIQTNSCHWYQLMSNERCICRFQKQKNMLQDSSPPCLRSTHTPQILCTGWPGGTTSHPIICQKDDWYKTALRNESSTRALSPSHNDNYWFLLCGVHPREKTSRQNSQLRHARRPSRHTGKPKRESARSASWELPQWDVFPCCTVSPLSFHMKNIQRPPPPPAGQPCRVPPGCRTAFIYSYCSLDSKKIVKKIKGGQASSERRWLPLLSRAGERESSGPETRAVDETVGGLECSSPQQSNF